MSRTTLRRHEIDVCRLELAVAQELCPNGHVYRHFIRLSTDKAGEEEGIRRVLSPRCLAMVSWINQSAKPVSALSYNRYLC